MHTERTLTRAHGNWVVGERFWDRESELDAFMERIDEGAHLLLVSQRRMGKTSLMKEAARRLSGRYIDIFVDLQKARTAQDAIAELSFAVKPYNTLWNKVKGTFASILGAVEEVDLSDLKFRLRAGLTAGDWADKGDQVFRVLAASEKPVLLLLDEVPILVNRLLKGDDFHITSERRGQADAFMSWLRQNSIEHQGKVRIVLSGSIGLEPILRQARLSSTINNLEPFELEPWEEGTAIECLRALARNYNLAFEDDAERKIVQRIGYCIPHHIQMFFDQVYELCKKNESMVFSGDKVDEVYENRMLGVRGHAELSHYEERLEMVLGKEAFELAIEMLTEAALTGCLSREAMQELKRSYTFEEEASTEVEQQIIGVLEHDGYLKQTDRGYVFLSNLLREWWIARYSDFYTPVAEREVRA